MKAIHWAVLLAVASSLFAQGDGGGNGGGGRGGGRGMRNFGPERILGGTVDELKTKLTLTDEQVPKVQGVFDETKEALQDAIEGMQQGGQQGFQGMREVLDKLRTDERAALKKVLDDKQKDAYDKLVAEQDSQRGQGRGGPGGGRGGRGGGDTPEARKARLDRAMTDLKLTTEQQETVKPLLDKLLQLMNDRDKAWADGRQGLQKLLAVEDTTDDDIKKELSSVRDKVAAIEKDLADARKLLGEALSPRQQAVLVTEGVLDK